MTNASCHNSLLSLWGGLKLSRERPKFILFQSLVLQLVRLCVYCISYCVLFPYSPPQVVVDSNPSLLRPPVGPVEMVSVVSGPNCMVILYRVVE